MLLYLIQRNFFGRCFLLLLHLFVQMHDSGKDVSLDVNTGRVIDLLNFADSADTNIGFDFVRVGIRF